MIGRRSDCSEGGIDLSRVLGRYPRSVLDHDARDESHASRMQAAAAAGSFSF